MRTNLPTSMVLVFGLAVAGCPSTPDAPDVPVTDVPSDPPPPTPIDRPPLPAANAVGSSDPSYGGQIRFLWDTWGAEVNGGWPPTEFMLALLRDEPDVFGEQFSNFGFLVDPTDDLPVGLKRGVEDPTRVGQTCSLCHVAELEDGRVWLGAVNLDLDLGGFRVAVNDRWVAAGNPPLVTDLERAKLLGLGPGRASSEGSENPMLVAADFPPYYNFQDRVRFSYMGALTDLRSLVFLTIFDTGAAAPFDPDALAPWPGDERVEEMVDFLLTTRGPAGPPPDPTLVAEGRALFERERCGECHHVGSPELDDVIPVDEVGVDRLPGEDPMWPLGTIGTDPHAYRLVADAAGGGSADPEILLRLRFISSRRLRVRPTTGYRALPMLTVWANPPYLHNGSVPTLEDLLRPAAERPATFMRGDFLVDTSVPGNSNQGHEFGTSITEPERAALAAYLRSL